MKKLVTRTEFSQDSDSLNDDNVSGSVRPRRLRLSASLRRLVTETDVLPRNLVMPIFVKEGQGIKEKIDSMPGVFRLSPDEMLDREISDIRSAGINSVLLFGLPNRKDAFGSEAFNDNGIVQQAVRRIKQNEPDIVIICDVCMCEYTDHGHCGILNQSGYVQNDVTIDYLGKIAVSQAKAGADIVGPSAMMDNQVLAIRRALDSNGFGDTSIMAYSSKYASGFYGSVQRGSRVGTKFWRPKDLPDGSLKRERGYPRNEN